MGSYRPLTQTEDALFRAMQDYHRDEIHGSKVAFIETYDPDTKLCAVTPQVSEYQETDSGDVKERAWPKMEDVPVLFAGGGEAGLTYPLKKGCPVLLIFCDRDIAEVMASDGQEPVAPENYDPSPETACFVLARYFPEKASKAPANKKDVFLYNSAGDVVLKSAKVRMGECSDDSGPSGDLSKALALTEKVDDRLNTLAGKIDAIIIELNAAVGAGGLVLTPPPAPVGALASVNSTVAFVKG